MHLNRIQIYRDAASQAKNKSNEVGDVSNKYAIATIDPVSSLSIPLKYAPPTAATENSDTARHNGSSPRRHQTAAEGCDRALDLAQRGWEVFSLCSGLFSLDFCLCIIKTEFQGSTRFGDQNKRPVFSTFRVTLSFSCRIMFFDAGHASADLLTIFESCCCAVKSSMPFRI